eukprot:4884117-Pyramimonas_sp.AAC.1
MDTFDPQEFRRQVLAEEQAERDLHERERRAAEARAHAAPAAGAAAQVAPGPGGVQDMQVDGGSLPARPGHAQPPAGGHAAAGEVGGVAGPVPEPPGIVGMSREELQDWCTKHNQRFEFWIQIK